MLLIDAHIPLSQICGSMKTFDYFRKQYCLIIIGYIQHVLQICKIHYFYNRIKTFHKKIVQKISQQCGNLYFLNMIVFRDSIVFINILCLFFSVPRRPLLKHVAIVMHTCIRNISIQYCSVEFHQLNRQKLVFMCPQSDNSWWFLKTSLTQLSIKVTVFFRLTLDSPAQIN